VPAASAVGTSELALVNSVARIAAWVGDIGISFRAEWRMGWNECGRGALRRRRSFVRRHCTIVPSMAAKAIRIGLSRIENV
jgi:hypothetical protein